MHLHEPVFGFSAEAVPDRMVSARSEPAAEDWLGARDLLWLTLAMAVAAAVLALI